MSPLLSAYAFYLDLCQAREAFSIHNRLAKMEGHQLASVLNSTCERLPFVNESDSNPGGNSLTKSYEKNK